MSDLRTGLVEAIRDVGDFDPEGILDAVLGFLTDNAEAWSLASRRHPSVAPEVDQFMARRLIAALSDSRDTGEKP